MVERKMLKQVIELMGRRELAQGSELMERRQLAQASELMERRQLAQGDKPMDLEVKLRWRSSELVNQEERQSAVRAREPVSDEMRKLAGTETRRLGQENDLRWCKTRLRSNDPASPETRRPARARSDPASPEARWSERVTDPGIPESRRIA